MAVIAPHVAWVGIAGAALLLCSAAFLSASVDGEKTAANEEVRAPAYVCMYKKTNFTSSRKNWKSLV
jgi:hypothetical protein